MFSSILITLVMIAQSAAPAAELYPNAAEVIAAQSVTGADQASAVKLARVTETAARDVAAARRSVRSLRGQHATLRRDYNTHLAELDKLSRQRASWNRDRQIAKKKSASAALAKRLGRLEKSISGASRSLVLRQHELLRAVKSELQGGVGGKRATELRRLKTTLTKRLRPKARKIILPDATIDRLADPEELEEQASLIARAERQIREEDAKLEERYRYYLKQQKLRAQSERATEVARRDNESVRRSPGIGAGAPSGEASTAEDAPQGDSDSGGDGDGDGIEDPTEPGAEDGGGSSRDFSLESSSVVLADVVDQVTASDLRRAGRSANPGTRAKAAKKARAQLRTRLAELKRQRARIQKRARDLRSR